MANTAKGSHAHGEHPGPLQPHAYAMFESVLHDIFPWTVTFSNSKTTSDTDKVVLSKHNITVMDKTKLERNHLFPSLRNISCNK